MGAKHIALKSLLIGAAGALVLEGGAWVLGSALGSLSEWRALILLGATRVMQAAWIMMVLARPEGGVRPMGLSGQALARGLRHGALWALGLGMAVLLAGGLMALAGMSPWRYFQLHIPAGVLGALLYFGVGGVVAPVAEELFFRGLLYGFFRRWGWTAALVISTACFVLAHGWPRQPPVAQLVGGVIFAAAYETSASLAAPMVVHVLGNLAIFTIALLV